MYSVQICRVPKPDTQAGRIAELPRMCMKDEHALPYDNKVPHVVAHPDIYAQDTPKNTLIRPHFREGHVSRSVACAILVLWLKTVRSVLRERE